MEQYFNIKNNHYKNVNFWGYHAKNYYIDKNNTLHAELRKCNGKYNKSSIKYDLKNIYGNTDGNFYPEIINNEVKSIYENKKIFNNTELLNQPITIFPNKTNKIVISLTTTPSKFITNDFDNFIISLKNQLVTPDYIYINICKIHDNLNNYDKTLYVYKLMLYLTKKHILSNNILINLYTENYGTLTSIFGITECPIQFEDNDIIIIVTDDDIINSKCTFYYYLCYSLYDCDMTCSIFDDLNNTIIFSDKYNDLIHSKNTYSIRFKLIKNLFEFYKQLIIDDATIEQNDSLLLQQYIYKNNLNCCSINLQFTDNIIKTNIKNNPDSIETRFQYFDRIEFFNIPKLNEYILIIKSVIPLNIHQYWNNPIIPEKMLFIINDIKNNNELFTHSLFDEDIGRKFIKNNFEEDVLWAFDNLIPQSYKSDLLRFCMLYYYGGIYIDVKWNTYIDLLLLTTNEYFCKDREFPYYDGYGIYTGVIICKKNNPLMKHSIEEIIKNVKNKYYGHNPLYPTGPGLLSEVSKTTNDIKKFDLFFNGINIIMNNSILFSEYPEYRDEQNKFGKNISYHNMWHEKNIYL